MKSIRETVNDFFIGVAHRFHMAEVRRRNAHIDRILDNLDPDVRTKFLLGLVDQRLDASGIKRYPIADGECERSACTLQT